jgi:TPP-dependent pyruvate/acetoin dehydrogenase alpha subunit
MSNNDKSNGKIDRRSFLKVMGTAGATAAFISVAKPPSLGEAFSAKPPIQPNNVPPEITQKAGDILAQQSKEKLSDMLSKMLRARKWETTMKDLFIGGKDNLYGAYHLYVGEEAVAVGVCGALNKDDYIASTHRGHGHVIAKGGDLNKMSAEIYFRQDGYNKGFGGSMHIADMSLGILGANGILGVGYYIAAGAAYGIKVRGGKQVAVSFCGEGGTNSVYMFSAMRNAMNYKLPYVAIVENNQYQIATPMITNIVTGETSNYTRGLGIPSVTVDGNDVAEVFAATQEAVARARAGFGPSLIEAMTYRWYDHYGFAGAKAGVDGAFGLPYRPDSEVKHWMALDPIPRFKEFLMERKFLTDSEIAQIDADAQKAVDDSMEFARKSAPVKAEDGLTNVYAKGSVEATQFFNGIKPTAWQQNPDHLVIAGRRGVPLMT